MKSLNIRVAFSAIDKLTRPVNAARLSAGGLSESLKKTQARIKDLESQSRTFTRLRDSVQKTSRQIDKTSRAYDGLNKAQKDGTQLTDKQRQHMAALAAKLERLNTTRTQEMVKLRAASQALRSHGVSLMGSDRTIQSAIRRTEQYNRTLERERRQLAAVTQARARYDRTQQTAGKLRSAGTVAVAGATVAAYGSGRFLAPAVGFDREMSRVQALTRIDKSSADFSALREQAKKLGAETQFTTTDAASGQAFLAMAGFTPKAIQDALPGVLNMALAGRMELGESADISSNILSQFRLDPKEMGRVSDVLTATFTRTNTDLQNIGEAMKYAGTGLANFSISVEQTSAMIGVLANVGLRGSIAGTGLQKVFSQLAAPTKRARAALDELGVSAADATGKLRPAEDILSELYAKIKKYSDTDQASFFKNIAGEEGMKSLQALVNAAGHGELQKLLAELEGAKGEAQKAANIMADNLDGDIKTLDSAWEGFRIQINDLVNNQLRSLIQGLSDVVGKMTDWAKENPRLAQSLLIVGGSVLALTAAIGGVSLVTGLILGPLSKLRLGFALLTSRRGITGAVSAFRALGTSSGPAMASVRGWGPVLSSLAGKLRGTSALMPGIRAGLMGAFMAPGAALGSLAKSIGMFALRLTGLPVIWGMITTAVSGLGVALSVILSPIGLIGAAFVAVGLLIWRFWEPIKAFFTGLFSGVMQQLAPFRDAFFTLTLVFSAIGDAVGKTWDWFKKLFTPIEASRESLDKCASAGETFGKVLGGALQLLLLPLTKLMEGIGWVLEKLGLIPSGLEAARLKAESLKKDPVMWEWDPQQKKMVKKGWDWASASPVANGAATEVSHAPPSLLTGDTGTQRRLQSIADNTGGILNETKKRIGPGDIVFKNLPRALAVRSEWQEPRLAGVMARQLSARPAVVSASLPAIQAELQPVSRRASSLPASPGGFTGEIHVHLHGVDRQDAREIGRIAAEAVNAEFSRRERLSRGSFKDKD